MLRIASVVKASVMQGGFEDLDGVSAFEEQVAVVAEQSAYDPAGVVVINAEPVPPMLRRIDSMLRQSAYRANMALSFEQLRIALDRNPVAMLEVYFAPAFGQR